MTNISTDLKKNFLNNKNTILRGKVIDRICDYDEGYTKADAEDFDKIMDDRFTEVSKDYIDYLKEFYPKLNERGIFDKIFAK